MLPGLSSHAYVLTDESGQYAPPEWAKTAIAIYHRLHADRMVAEVNYGGGMVEATIRAIDPNVSYTSVTASRGKVARAEPVAAFYEQGRVHHLGSFPELEDQMCGFTTAFDRRTAGYSPGRVDALVWAITELMVKPMSSYGIFELYRRQALALPLQRQTPSDHDCRGGKADRMLERCAQENIRFAQISRGGRLPTPEEAAAHVAAIDNIKTGG